MGVLEDYQFIFLCDGDQGTASKDLVQVPIGPVTRARAKKFKDVLNGLIQELWAQANSWRPIVHDPRGQQRIVTLIQVLEGSSQGNNWQEIFWVYSRRIELHGYSKRHFLSFYVVFCFLLYDSRRPALLSYSSSFLLRQVGIYFSFD
jgi:hypothetical protein